jgi:predicted MFS family arabinose efflux permease
MSQAVTGLILCRSRLWMYRALPVFASGVLGVLAMVGLALGHTVLLLALGTILFGVYSGCFFFYLVYHAIAHPVRAPAYVAINEAVVGAGGILGPLAGGLLLDRGGNLASAVVGAAFILLITLFQTFVHRQHPVAAS